MRVAIEIGPVGQSQADARGVLVAQPVENVEPPLSELATTGELRGERGEAVLFHAAGTRLVAGFRATRLGLEGVEPAHEQLGVLEFLVTHSSRRLRHGEDLLEPKESHRDRPTYCHAAVRRPR